MHLEEAARHLGARKLPALVRTLLLIPAHGQGALAQRAYEQLDQAVVHGSGLRGAARADGLQPLVQRHGEVGGQAQV